MTRYLKILRLFWSTSVAAEAEYRINFLIAAVTSIGGLAGSIFGLFLFYRSGYQLGGWRWEEALIVTGLFTMLEGLTATFLSPNLSRIVRHVQTGTLDFVLLKPVDSQFWLSTRNLSLTGLPDALLGLAMIFYASTRLALTGAAVLRGAGPIILALLVLYSLWFALSTLSVWFVKIYNVTEVLRGLLDAGRFPISAYPAGYRFFFTFIVPVTFLTTIPAQAILGRAEHRWLIAATLVAIALLILSRMLWKYAMRHYTSASS